MKRVLSLVLALSMVMSMFTFAFAGTSLTDVVGTKYEAAVEALVELGIVSGYEDGTYLPEKTVTRAEMAKLLVIAAGLEPAAKVAVGTTKFADVPADHWACGYINVAAEYGYISGYPEGTFLPDETVSYAEAITMVLRVLGYKSVVEAKGTWPTNYIAKAQDLELLDGVDYGTYAEGATRGNIAIIIWNMLKTEMWDITGESEGDGLMSAGIGKTMLEVKFPDYKYLDEENKATYAGFTIDDGKVLVYLVDSSESREVEDIDQEMQPQRRVALQMVAPSMRELDFYAHGFEYLGNDFYTFIEGQKVEALINVKDEKILMMAPTGDEKLVEGTKIELAEDYEVGFALFNYAYGLIYQGHTVSLTQLYVTSSYINEINTSNKSKIKFENNDALPYIDYDDAEDEIFLKNGERVSVKDIKVGDVLSKVIVTSERRGMEVQTRGVMINPYDYLGIHDEVFYIIESSDVEGKLTKFEKEYDENSFNGEDEYTVATIGGERYYVNGNAEYFEDPENEDLDPKTFASDGIDSDMKNEIIEGKLDFLGNLVVAFFDGEFNGGDADGEGTVKFFALTDDVDGQEIAVENEDGEDTLRFAKKSTANAWNEDELAGYFTVATLDDDEELEGFVDYAGVKFMVRQNDSGDLADEVGGFNGRTIKYGKEDDEYYNVIVGRNAAFDDDNSTILEQKVNDSTVVVTLIHDDKGTTREKDDEYRVEFSEGLEAIEKLKDDPAIVIIDNANKFARAKYVVIFDEVSNREDNLVGIVADVTDDGLSGKRVAVADTRLETAKEIKEAKKDALLYKVGPRGEDHSGDLDDAQVVVYSAEENKDEEMEMTIVYKLDCYDLNLESEYHGYIAKGTSDNKNVSDDGREAVMFMSAGEANEFDFEYNHEEQTAILDLDNEKFVDEVEDFMVVIVKVEVDDEDENQYNAVSYDIVDYADLKLKELDRMFIRDDAEVVFIIRGMAEAIEGHYPYVIST